MANTLDHRERLLRTLHKQLVVGAKSVEWGFLFLLTDKIGQAWNNIEVKI